MMSSSEYLFIEKSVPSQNMLRALINSEEKNEWFNGCITQLTKESKKEWDDIYRIAKDTSIENQKGNPSVIMIY